MIDRKDFREEADKVLDWVDNYFKKLKDLPVKSQSKPGEIYSRIPEQAPDMPEGMETLLADLDKIIIPGITHWQHPNFHAYFPANSSYESLLAETITAAIGAQCMVWETSPAATELEERMMQWLAHEVGLPETFEGVIQDSASSSTLTAILTAREVATGFQSNETGVPNNLRVYCSAEAHSSVEKAVGVCGIGRKNLVKIGVDDNMRMNVDELREAIRKDKAEGKLPVCVIAAIGTTGTVAIDPLDKIAEVCAEEKVWLHVDAAYAGTAVILPEYRYLFKGIEKADSLVFNPHKWMYTNFDSSAYFVKDTDSLIRTFDILPEYLKTATRGVVKDYRDWGVQLGRRFRALKLWFVMRGFGMEGIRERVREQIALNEYFATELVKTGEFELMQKPFIAFTCFRYVDKDVKSEEKLDELNKRLLERINSSGKVYMSHTKIRGRYVIRFHSAQTYITREDVDLAIKTLLQYI